MNFVTLAFWLAIVSSIVEIACYICVLVHTWRGSKDTWVIKITTMLMICSVLVIYNVSVERKLQVKNPQKPSFAIYLLMITWCATNVLTGIAHFLIAKKYSSIANKVPLIFAGKIPKEGMSRALWKILFWCNIIIPIANSVFFWLANIDKITEDKTSTQFVQTVEPIMIDLQGAIYTVTGIILVRSVY